MAEHVGNPGDLKGTFTLVMHGGKYLDDLETVAFLDLEGDRYSIKPFAPDFRYKIIEGLPAEEALKKAMQHVSFNPSVTGTWLKRIVNKEGDIIGYELRPLYMPLTYGERDVLEVSYRLMPGGKVRAYVRVKERVKRRLAGEGDTFIWGK